MREYARTVAVLLAAGGAWSCAAGDASSDDAARSDAAAVDAPATNAGARAAQTSADGGVLGTIHADLDGEARTWYVVEGDVRGEAYASGMFLDGEDGRIVTLGGFDTADPPLDSFQTDVAAGNLSLGDYEGSSFTLAVTIPAGRSSMRAEVDRGLATATLAYMPEAAMGDVMAGTLFAQSGWIEVESAEFSDSEGALRGTFSGEIALTDGSRSVTVTNGRFEVAGLPSP